MNPEPENEYDVAIIGSGVSGVNIARRLSAYEVKVAVLEKAVDFSFGTSKANSGIIHGGFHHNKSFLKARLEIKGNLMFDQLRKELDFPFKRCGIIVAALHEDEMKVVEHLYRQGIENEAAGLELCSRERILELEPKLSHDVLGGLFAPGGGIIEPYRFVLALAESAQKNGVHFFTEFEVVKGIYDTGGTEHHSGDRMPGRDEASRDEAQRDRMPERDQAQRDRAWKIISKDRREINARYVVNTAGLFADEVSKAFNAEDFTIQARKGEYFLLDKMTPARPDKVVFPVPTPISKGMLVIPTVEGTVLIGPTAEDQNNKENFSTTRDKLEQILDSSKAMIPSLSQNDIITSFAGLRPCLDEDFYIEPSKIVPAFIQVAGIQSPGLTASPAIGEYVVELLEKTGLKLLKKPEWDPYVRDRARSRTLSPNELDKLVGKDPSWGNVVCRCENVSEAEIIEAINLGHLTLDGIKYFSRAQMGRCQGGFCTYKILKIIMRETGQTWETISKHGGSSKLLNGEL